jgi:hypothetical protein
MSGPLADGRSTYQVGTEFRNCVSNRSGMLLTCTGKSTIKPLAVSGIFVLLLAACGRSVQFDYYDFDFQKPLDVEN